MSSQSRRDLLHILGTARGGCHVGRSVLEFFRRRRGTVGEEAGRRAAQDYIPRADFLRGVDIMDEDDGALAFSNKHVPRWTEGCNWLRGRTRRTLLCSCFEAELSSPPALSRYGLQGSPCSDWEDVGMHRALHHSYVHLIEPSRSRHQQYLKSGPRKILLHIQKCQLRSRCAVHWLK